MEEMMGNKGLLTVIVVVLIGIFTVLVIQMNEETPAEQISNSVSETFEEVGDEIDDATTN
jgi:NADH:ubiquinone oxidoreductase subunit 6 (subunit J)